MKKRDNKIEEKDIKESLAKAEAALTGKTTPDVLAQMVHEEQLRLKKAAKLEKREREDEQARMNPEENYYSPRLSPTKPNNEEELDGFVVIKVTENQEHDLTQ